MIQSIVLIAVIPIPHDAGAYNRSRRTAEELLRDGTAVLFDVHRDAVPPEEYIETVNSQETVQIQFVVGRQNQNMETNRQFAERSFQYSLFVAPFYKIPTSRLRILITCRNKIPCTSCTSLDYP